MSKFENVRQIRQERRLVLRHRDNITRVFVDYEKTSYRPARIPPGTRLGYSLRPLHVVSPRLKTRKSRYPQDRCSESNGKTKIFLNPLRAHRYAHTPQRAFYRRDRVRGAYADRRTSGGGGGLRRGAVNVNVYIYYTYRRSRRRSETVRREEGEGGHVRALLSRRPAAAAATTSFENHRPCHPNVRRRRLRLRLFLLYMR